MDEWVKCNSKWEQMIIIKISYINNNKNWNLQNKIIWSDYKSYMSIFIWYIA